MNENKTTLFAMISYPEVIKEALNFNRDNEIFKVDCYCDQDKIYLEALTLICHHLAYGDRVRTAVFTQILMPNAIFFNEEDFIRLWSTHRVPLPITKVDD